MKRLGIDTGSLFTGCVLLEDSAVSAFEYRPHRGDVARSVRTLLENDTFRDYDLVGVSTAFEQPSSGAIDPLLSVIEGARHLIPGCRNVMSIGGQTFALVFYDENGEYREHSTNPPCASGTGSFLEQQAERLGVSVEELAARRARAVENYIREKGNLKPDRVFLVEPVVAPGKGGQGGSEVDFKLR